MIDLDHADIAAVEEGAGRAAALLKLLANERRLLILCQLAGGELSVGALHARLGQSQTALSQSALSQHLALLREQGIVATRRESQTIYYRIADTAALRVIQTLAELFCPPEQENAP